MRVVGSPKSSEVGGSTFHDSSIDSSSRVIICLSQCIFLTSGEGRGTIKNDIWSAQQRLVTSHMKQWPPVFDSPESTIMNN